LNNNLGNYQDLMNLEGEMMEKKSKKKENSSAEQHTN